MYLLQNAYQWRFKRMKVTGPQAPPTLTMWATGLSWLTPIPATAGGSFM